MDHIKKAFQKVKQDINSLKKEIDALKSNLVENREKMIEICEIIKKVNKKIENFTPNNTISTSTDRHIISAYPTHLSTHHLPLKALKAPNMPISSGNQGASTDRQTDRQTDRHIENNENSINDAAKILDSLDNIKKEVRIKFKAITEQEFLVFSTIYQIEEELGYSNYKILSQKLNPTESSIRDYVGRLIKKGIPVEKKKINNKNIQLSISKNLKKIATLSTILKLRDL
jgi:septal ring factor EnvC (AmiA/AmiB activator)